MSKYIYGYTYYGDWDEEIYTFIKINKKDKEKFISYCKESEKINLYEIQGLQLLCFVDNIEIYNNRLEQNNEKYSDIKTIQQYQDEIKNCLNKMEKENSLYKQYDLLENLSKYDFLE